MSKNIGLIIVLIIAMIIGFISMVTSAMSASDIRSGQNKLDSDHNNGDLNEAHKTATVSAVLQGVVLGLILIGLLIYLMYKKGGDIQEALKDGHGAAQQWFDQRNVKK